MEGTHTGGTRRGTSTTFARAMTGTAVDTSTSESTSENDSS